MDYKNKYLKYKNKYLKLKNQSGGVSMGFADRLFNSNRKLAEKAHEREKREKLAKEAREREQRKREEYDSEPIDIETSDEESSDVEDTINNIMRCYKCGTEIKAQQNNINVYNNKLYCENCYKLI